MDLDHQVLQLHAVEVSRECWKCKPYAWKRKSPLQLGGRGVFVFRLIDPVVQFFQVGAELLHRCRLEAALEELSTVCFSCAARRASRRLLVFLS